MRFVGIDIASEEHVVAIVDETGQVVLKPTKVKEDAHGYAKLAELLGSPDGALVAMEATGHYWQNLFAALSANGFKIALLNPLRTRRFAEEDLVRAKTDSIDAVAIARFAAQKRPTTTDMPEPATIELKALVRHRDRLLQAFGDATRQLHRLIDLCFPEFTRFVKDPSSQLATAILGAWPTATALASVPPKRIAKVRYDGVHRVGDELASQLVAAAKVSVGAHHGNGYRVQVRHVCEELALLRRQLKELDDDIRGVLEGHEVGKLLTTIDGIGPHSAARIIAEVGDPARFRDAGALAAYVGVAPATRQSGKRQAHAAGTTYGNARLRHWLWMPTLRAAKHNPWLAAFHGRLLAAGKPWKVAAIAAMRKLLVAVHAVARSRRPFVARIGGIAS